MGGVLGIKVKIMLPWDPQGKIGPRKPLPDHVNIVEPKDEQPITGPQSISREVKCARLFYNLTYTLDLIGAKKAQAYDSQMILTPRDLFVCGLEVVFINGGVDVALRGEVIQRGVHLLLRHLCPHLLVDAVPIPH